MYQGCQLWYTEINQLLEISEKLEEELSLPWNEGDSLEESLKTWRRMARVFLHELEQLTEGTPYFLDNFRNARIVASRLMPFGESVVKQLEARIGKTSNTLEKILQFYTMKQEIYSDLLCVADDSKLSMLLIEEINKVMTGISSCITTAMLNEYISSNVEPLRLQCIHFSSGQEEYLDDFHICFNDYEALCQKAGETLQEVTTGKDGLRFLKEQMLHLATKITPTLEQETIRQVMNLVMVEKGFPHVGFREKTLNNGLNIIEDLFLYRPGVAVSILIRWDRKIILVVGGLTKDNREPSKEESRGVREYILSFQENIPNIQEKMLRKGIIMGEQLSDIRSLDDIVMLNQNEFQCPRELEVFGNHSEKKRVLAQEKGEV